MLPREYSRTPCRDSMGGRRKRLAGRSRRHPPRSARSRKMHPAVRYGDRKARSAAPDRGSARVRDTLPAPPRAPCRTPRSPAEWRRIAGRFRGSVRPRGTDAPRCRRYRVAWHRGVPPAAAFPATSSGRWSGTGSAWGSTRATGATAGFPIRLPIQREG